MLVGDDVLPPEPGTMMGPGFLGETREEAEQAAKTHSGSSEPVN